MRGVVLFVLVYTHAVPTFLLKTEPFEYSFADLVRDKRVVWEGVSSAPALLALRGAKKGDEAFIYHTGGEKQIVGLARVTKGAYAPDAENPKAVVIDLAPLKPALTPVTLARIKADPRFKDFALVRQSRLSVMLVPPALDAILREWTGL